MNYTDYKWMRKTIWKLPYELQCNWGDRIYNIEQNDLKLMPFYFENLALVNNDGKK